MTAKLTIGILGTAKASQVTELCAACRQLNAEVVLADPKRLTCRLPGNELLLRQADGSHVALHQLDALLIRMLPGGSLEQVVFRLDALNALAEQGVPVINSSRVMEQTVDKCRTTWLLAAAGLPTPRTLVTERFDEAMAAAGDWGDVVVKPVFGSLGKGLVRVSDPELAYRTFRALELGRYIYYIQEYLEHGGDDYRLFVLDGKVLAAMKRQGRGWRSNISLGGRAQPYEPTPIMAELALRAAAVVGADYLGVDIVVSNGQPYLIEVNGIPGWAGLQQVTTENIAERVIAHVLTKAAGHGQ